MATLARELRKELEKTVVKARIESEAGARKALEEYAVHESKPYSFMNQQRQQLRERLRARGVQAGDTQHKDHSQTLQHLCAEFAYEHWHRMLFARFLAENELLIQPGSEMPISLDECRELAKDENKDWLTLASEYAQRMLPAIFRADDPVLELSLPLESRNKLESWLKDLPKDVFLADDSLGWVYQFWQAKKKDEVNKSEVKIGSDEIAPVTQLFTEDYMVLFLLHNTLGAWWVAKRKREGTVHDLRGYEWTYLRFKDDGLPAAGAFDGWPTLARDLKVLDPCMGSGHFLVFALPILVGFRIEEEGLSIADAIMAVLRDNLYGLEIDARCTQIAAFNLALTAWKLAGAHFQLPSLNLACSGLGINANEEDWVRLAGKDQLSRETMRELYYLFKQAPILGSLIDPKRVGDHLFAANFEKVRPLLQQALAAEHKDIAENELSVTAKGLLEAADILADNFTLIATNVPYLGRGKQDAVLASYCDDKHADARADLATSFLDRCVRFCGSKGTVGLVSTQYWLFLARYKKFRVRLLTTTSWNFIARLGPGAFETISGEVVNVCLLGLTRAPATNHEFYGVDVTDADGPDGKAHALANDEVLMISQDGQKRNPDSRVLIERVRAQGALLADYAIISEGLHTGDYPRFGRNFWELPSLQPPWEAQQAAPMEPAFASGREFALKWNGGEGDLIDFVRERLGTDTLSAWIKGDSVWGHKGIAMSSMADLRATLYTGQVFTHGAYGIVPNDQEDLPAIFAFADSGQLAKEVRKLDKKVAVARKSVASAPFDVEHWRTIATQKYPDGFPKAHSHDATQWLFNGHPRGSQQSLQVAVARLVGYQWPRQTGSSFLDCPAVGEDGLEQFVAEDGIVCLGALQGHRAGVDRLSKLLAEAFPQEWPDNLQHLLKQSGTKSGTLETWLRDEFFAQHCDVFHNRPSVWHVSDGLDQGFHALVNYHKLAAPHDEGKRTLEKLTYTYLGEWIERQRGDQKRGIAGSDARLASAEHLQKQLKAIIAGVEPYDVFVRWKPLHKQAIGWEPDINDGVRLNIRPFINARPLNGKGKNACILRVRPGSSLKWTKDKGTEPNREKQDFPWFWSWDEQTDDFTGGAKFDGNRWNDLHYSLEMKRKARDQQEAKGKKGQYA